MRHDGRPVSTGVVGGDGSDGDDGGGGTCRVDGGCGCGCGWVGEGPECFGGKHMWDAAGQAVRTYR